MAYADDYVKTSWVNSPSTSTPINQTNLNHIEDGIKTNCSRISAMSSDLDTAGNNIGTLQTDMTNAQNDIGGLQTAVAGKQDALTFDNAPTLNSDNPVKSNGIKQALDLKQDALTFDNTPTSGSSNPVTSDGIYQALAGAGIGTLAGLIDVDITDPQNGDTLVYDSVNQMWVNQGAAPGVSVTLTLRGAKEDVITIKDSNNVTVDTVTFASGQTTATTTITVPVGGGTYKFISSVAKDTTSGTSDYEKTVTLSDSASQTVNVYPSGALYWYGNEIGGLITSVATSWDAGFTLKAPSLTKNTNSFTFTTASDASGDTCGVVYVDGKVDLNSISSIKVNCSGTVGAYAYAGVSQFTAPNLTVGFTRSSTHGIATANTPSFTGISTNDVSAVTTENYIGFSIVDNSTQTPFTTLTVDAIWAVNPHENDLKINGAKEDTITIKDSNNQTVATCIFGSGKTYGYVSKALLPSGTYTFTSSVAKIKSGGTFVDYTKSINLDGSETEVEIYPDKAIYWYGNFIKSFATGTWTGQTLTNPTINTNSFNFTHNGTGYFHALYISDTIDFTGYTSVKAILDGSCTETSGNLIGLFNGTDHSDFTQTLYSLNNYNDALNEIALTQPNSNGRIGIKFQLDPPKTCNMTFHAIYGE